MKNSILTFTVIAAFGAAAIQAVGQTGPAPSFHVVRSTSPEKGHLTLTRTTTVFEAYNYVVKVLVNGQPRDEVRTAHRSVPVEYDVVYDIGSSRVITPDGKQLPIDDVWKRLKANTIVLVSGDFQTPAAPFLRSLRADTLVIIPAPPKDGPKGVPAKKPPEVKPGDPH